MKELTIKDILKIILNRIVLVVIIPLAAITVAAYASYNLIPPTYTATTTMYVLNQQNNESVNYTDLTSGALLIQDYQGLALSHRVQDAAAADVGLPSMEDYDVTVSSAQNTRLIEIKVVGPDAAMSANVANAIAQNLSECIREVMKVENINVIDVAATPIAPSGPNKIRNILLAGLVGLALSVGIALLIEMVNTTIRTADDVEMILGVPVLAQIPKMDTRRLD